MSADLERAANALWHIQTGAVDDSWNSLSGHNQGLMLRDVRAAISAYLEGAPVVEVRRTELGMSVHGLCVSCGAEAGTYRLVKEVK